MQQNQSAQPRRIISQTRLPRELSTLIAQAKDYADGQIADLVVNEKVAKNPHTYMLFHMSSKMYVPWPHGRLKLREGNKVNTLLVMSNLLYGGTRLVPVVICHRYDKNGHMDAEVLTNAVDI